MHLHFERNVNAKCDCTILSLSWMGKVPDELPEEEGWKLNRNNYYQEGWLATGNVRGVVGVTFTSSHARRPHELPLRTNYNLRGHRSDVILVKWNEPYQKLASCDSSGVIFVWIKYEGRWSIELINDRSTPVTHFSWSHDGRMALICYQDGFVLVGSVAGQRYWSSMLSLDARITCGCWTPDDNQVYLGTASAQLVVMDVHGAMVSQVQLVAEGGITSMAWSCEKFKMEEGEESTESNGGHVLAVALGNGEIVLLRGHDDVSPVRVHTGLRGNTLAMEWANSRELLAVAGTLIPEADEFPDTPPYKNVVKFYSDTGVLIYTVPIPYTQARVSALTWGHAARRLFVGVGGAVCTARVWRVVAPLQLLARVRAAQALREPRLAALLPLPPRLQPALANLFAHTIRCTVPESSELRRFVSRPPAAGGRLHCTMLRHDDEEAGAYTLYLEHLGGLVPLLKGRRTSKIRPEFVIFDPQAEEGASKSAARESSSSSSGAGSSSSSSAGAAASPRTPRTPRRTHHAPPPPNTTHALQVAHTSSSDTEREEGCSGSPRLQRRRRARERRKVRNSSEKDDAHDELAYIDSLPEDVRLVEVTSNIWGTKFKMHGLAKNVPANLGQVTYKTSLLHLQPRQMTLMITELRDDYPVGPDPNFNPNIFSEDEEEVFQSNDSNSSPSHTNNNIRRKVTLNERINNSNNILNQSDAYSSNNNNTHGPSLARAESYEEFPYIDTNDTMNNVPENVYSTPVRHATQTTDRRVNNTGVPNRHAISPLRCESSVPTLQSPKNAVAPTDIIFERPSPQTVTCGGRGDFCGGRADYGVRGDNVSLKGNLSNIDQQSFSLNLSLEPSRQVTIKKCDSHITDNCLSKLRKNICSRGDSGSYDMNTRILKSLCNKNYEHEVHPDAMTRRTETLKNLQKGEDLKFIDEETPVDTTINNITERSREMRVQRTTTVVPISPVCANLPVYDTMTRSCSVGYLDLVDPQVLHAQVSLTALRGEPPRRLVLVNNKRHRRPRRHHRTTDIKQVECTRTPSLKKCGKSRSLDSSEMSAAAEKGSKHLKAEAVSHRGEGASANSSSRCTSTGGEDNGATSTEEGGRRGRRDYPVCTRCRLVSPYDRRDVDAATYVCVACGVTAPTAVANPAVAAPAAAPVSSAPPSRSAATDSDSDYSSLEQLALRLLASRGTRRGAREAREARAAREVRESSSAPASPRPARSSGTGAAPAPEATPRRTRYSSASPIRQLLNSPLLNRRRNKKPSESSDDEYSNGSGYNEVNSKNYRDLESFQKAQLRNKLKRAGTAGGGVVASDGRSSPHSRRQLVMHNKAPMWNENSQVYQLDFGGRVTQESAKNFQIEYHGKQVMQFGRIDGNAYTLDFQYPFSALQAFAVALANVTQRLK
ncbi:tubby-related protein 4 isoform X2 [Galleria mellonella]|uniref:Tubby-related protein 4 isoform X2 n=1 Tax=Galleria mellonella TaxID=7137 RepID=A0A6J3C4T2_GALME|nr:tubby-related protein 4 isoform X2 [Galleria mellonella]